MIIYDRKYNIFRCFIVQGKLPRSFPCLKCETREQAKEYEKNLRQRLNIGYGTIEDVSTES